MNKYQEALKNIEFMGDKDLYNERHIEWANTLQELVDKETPKKPIPYLNSLFKCENCKSPFQNYHYQNRCPNCGQALDWNNTNESNN